MRSTTIGNQFGTSTRLLLLSATALALIPQAAGAQSAPSASPSASKVSDGEPQTQLGVGDIIVTANKRSESLNRVGLTIQAFSGDDLKKQNVKKIEDLISVVPSLSYALTTTNTPVYSLRGVGYYDTSLGAIPSVAVYVDEVPYPISTLASQVVLDLERVEVLKGPQGTLFGESSTGGAINFIAAKPTPDLAYGADISYGRFNVIETTGYVGGPLSDTLSYRVALKGVHGDDWQRSYIRDDTLGERKLFAGRASFLLEPDDGVKILATASGHIDRSDPLAPQFILLRKQTQGNFPVLDSIPYAPDKARAANWSPSRRPEGDDKQYNFSLRGDLDLSSALTLTSITSFAHFTRDQQTDADGITPLNFSSSQQGKARVFTQELRIANDEHADLRWTVGANYAYNKVNENSLLDTFEASFILLNPTFWETNGYGLNQTSNAYAAFANIEFDVTDQITLKGGIRYNHTRRVADACTQDTDRNSTLAAFFTDLANGLRAQQGLGPITPLPPGACVELDNVSRDSQGRILYLPGIFRGTLTEENVPWRVGIDFKPNNNLLFYFNVAKGYKSGGFSSVGGATYTQYAPITQESLLDIEGGVKAQLIDRRLNLNAALFRYNYRDKQLRGKILDSVFFLLDALQNVPKSHINGAEINFAYSPTPELKLGSAVTYLDGNVDKYGGYNDLGQLVDLSGTPIPFAPKWSVTANAEIDKPVSDTYNLQAGLNLLYNSATTATVGNDSVSRIRDFVTVDGRIGLQNKDNNWTISLWAKNIFDRFYWTNTYAVSDTRVRYAAMPRTFGISFSIRN